MSNKRVAALGGLLGVLMSLSAPISAHSKSVNERCLNGRHEKWEHNGWRRDGRSCYDVRHDNRGHHNKKDVRKDFGAIRSARKEVAQDRQELRGDYQELRKDRAELRRDLRSGASQKEIFQDRQEIRGDFKEITKDRKELQQDQARLETTRRELKADLRKK